MTVFITLRLKSGVDIEGQPSGQGLGQFADPDECKSVTERNNVRSLNDFFYRDRELYEEIASEIDGEECEEFDDFLSEVRQQQEWHDPRDGLTTVRVLLAHFSTRLEDSRESEFLAQIVEELQFVKTQLEAAVINDDPFRLEVSE